MAVDWFARGIGGGGIAVAVWTALSAARRERRQLRPIVICVEVQAPTEVPEGGQLAAIVQVRNQSAAAAYNVRLGIELAGARITWGEEMLNPPRLNQLLAGQDAGELQVLVPSGWAFERGTDPRAERVYWVDYQDASDWWWTARNPWQGQEDVEVRLIGGKLRWWLHRRVQSTRQRRALRRGQRAAQRALEAGPPDQAG